MKSDSNYAYCVSEIPLFHVLNARITFGNIFALDTAVDGVSNLEEAGNTFCTVDESCFEAPAGYMRLGEAPSGESDFFFFQ